MELSNIQAINSTTHYWGYRELSTEEISVVGGGGDFSGDGFDSGGANGCGSSENATGNQAAAATASMAAAAECDLARATALAGLAGAIAGRGGMALQGLEAYRTWCSADM